MWADFFGGLVDLFLWGLVSTPISGEPLPKLKLHNTLSNQLEEFEPLGRVVKMYNCGPTPYDEQHLGNMVPALLGNTIRRALTRWGYKVEQVTNITDFGHLSGDNEGNPDIGEDKMTKGLAREGLSPTMANMRKLAEKYTEIFLHDIANLGVPVSKIKFPRASDYIPEQVALIKTLFEKGYAYQTSDGIYYDTSKFKDYGKLGNINLGGQETGARVAENSEKKNPHDFALWKFSKDKKFGWKSPWGWGFPGWHIECTAMIFKLLGKQIDIHTGGIEHIPIHHNNEIAQAEAITGKQFVKYWLHNNHITIEGKKVSKSLGNTVYLHNLVDKGYSPRAFRYWFLTGHYRTPMNFTWDAIEGADTALKRLTRFFLELPVHSDLSASTEQHQAASKAFRDDFYNAIANDLNTAQALARVWELVKDDSVPPATKRQLLIEADQLLGLGYTEPQATVKVIVQGKVQELVEEREKARKEKDFTKADELRKQIEDKGYEVKDTSEGAEVSKK